MVDRPPAGTIPDAPGSYQFKDREGRVIYVGKAASLRSRRRELLPGPAGARRRARLRWSLPRSPSSGSRCATRSKRSCSSTASSSSTGPGSTSGCGTTRAIRSWRSRSTTSGRGRWSCAAAKRKGVRYFGPYAHAYAIRDTLDMLLRTFPIRTCSDSKLARHQRLGRPCLLFHIEKCSGPCVGEIDKETYDRLVSELVEFLDGDTEGARPPARAGHARGRGRVGVRAGCPPPGPSDQRHEGDRAPADGGRSQRGPRRRRHRRRRPGGGQSRSSTCGGGGWSGGRASSWTRSRT